ncbi:hypothetical protein [Chlorobaculum limnaeum]|uniref:hypothetical protein n=1 Tax=Chlorobaculum limnaeum TaxID=274537 RepID=UPI001969C98C|nr:hypothetical protein [Chlorobaculum limnaeum]
MKTRDYLAIFLTSRLMTSFEAVAKKTSRKNNINNNKISIYKQNQQLTAGTGRSRPEHNGFSSPNARCGFATGDAC